MNKKLTSYTITRYLADALAIVMSYLFNLLIYFGNISSGFNTLFLVFSISFWYIVSQISKLYADRRSNKFSEEIIFISYNILLVSILLSSAMYFFELKPNYSTRFFSEYLVYLFVFVAAIKYILRKSIHAALYQGRLFDKFLLVGSTPAALNYYETISKYYYYGYECLGLIDEKPSKINGCPYFGKIDSLSHILKLKPSTKW